MYKSIRIDIQSPCLWNCFPLEESWIRRIDGYDVETVRYHYRSHKTESVEEEQVDVYTFIGRMIQHILPKGV